MSDTDQELLQSYAQTQCEDAFTTLVKRHVNLVYSAARRQVRSPQLAEEVAQSVFTDLARNAAKLNTDTGGTTVLTAWLYQVTRRTAIDVVRREARRQLREQIATEMNSMNVTTADWTHIEPLLDEAMSALDETDRAAILLRYFENKSLREVGATLGTSDDAAQKRVSRAVERLREFLAKRGVTVGASALAVVISANAVQAAPVGLALTISTAAAIIGTTLATTTTATATTTAIKTIAMTTLQKTLITATVAVLAGAGIYQARQAVTLRGENQMLQRQQAPLTEQIQQLQRERDDATNMLASLNDKNAQLKSNPNGAEVLKLRNEVTRLRATAQQQQKQMKTAGTDPNDPATQKFLEAKAQAEQIAHYLTQMPDKAIPELRLMRDVDWLIASEEAKFGTDADVRQTLRKVRSLAKDRMPMGRSLNAFARANNGQLPADISQLKPYFKAALGDTTLDDASLDAIFDRYKLLHTGNLSDFPQGTWFIVEKAPVDKDYDSRAKFGNGLSTIISTGIGETGDPDDKSY